MIIHCGISFVLSDVLIPCHGYDIYCYVEVSCNVMMINHLMCNYCILWCALHILCDIQFYWCENSMMKCDIKNTCIDIDLSVCTLMPNYDHQLSFIQLALQNIALGHLVINKIVYSCPMKYANIGINSRENTILSVPCNDIEQAMQHLLKSWHISEKYGFIITYLKQCSCDI